MRPENAPLSDPKRACMYTVVLAGNPNVGKSTVFNALTGLHQHTGNWPGKTVEAAVGKFRYNGRTYRLADLPGTYSLYAHSPEEEAARDYLRSGEADVVVVVCDATCLERNLLLALQILALARNVILCLNMADDALRRGIRIDTDTLSDMLGTDVVYISARNKRSLRPLLEAIESYALSAPEEPGSAEESLRALPEDVDAVIREIARLVISYDAVLRQRHAAAADRVLTSRRYGYPLMVFLLAALLWLTIVGANYPSQLLMSGLFRLGELAETALLQFGVPVLICDALIRGVWRVLAWVVSVMLPPMAVFFPLFTLMEDAGLLPRIAFNLDKPLHRCHACGKQALTMCIRKSMVFL